MVCFIERDTINRLILCDFGTAAVLGDMDMLFTNTYTGTRWYIAPEILLSSEKSYDPFKADCMYSIFSI
jgi:serine/threonine protein kinase